MYKSLILALPFLVVLSACGDKKDTVSTAANRMVTKAQAEPANAVPSSKDLAEAQANLAQFATKQGYQAVLNPQGVVIFDSPVAMFEVFNDYPKERNQFELIKAKPLTIRLSREWIESSPEDVVQGETEMTLVQGVLNVFSRTKEPEVTILAVPRSNKNKFNESHAMTATVSREQVLVALKELGLATSFDDLVQTKINTEYRVVGLGASKQYDAIVYKNDNRRRLIVRLVGT